MSTNTDKTGMLSHGSFLTLIYQNKKKDSTLVQIQNGVKHFCHFPFNSFVALYLWQIMNLVAIMRTIEESALMYFFSGISTMPYISFDYCFSFSSPEPKPVTNASCYDKHFIPWWLSAVTPGL